MSTKESSETSFDINSPDWLTRRGGSVKRASDHRTWFVLWDGKPQHKLTVVPVQGKFGCVVRQTINGRPVPSTIVEDSPKQALQSALDELGKKLGWN